LSRTSSIRWSRRSRWRASRADPPSSSTTHGQRASDGRERFVPLTFGAQVDEDHPVVEPADLGPGRLQGEAGLAGPARSREGHEPHGVVREQDAQAVQGRLTAEERGGRGGQIRGSPPRRRRRSGRLEALGQQDGEIVQQQVVQLGRMSMSGATQP
jgi:hypothetical protein